MMLPNIGCTNVATLDTSNLEESKAQMDATVGRCTSNLTKENCADFFKAAKETSYEADKIILKSKVLTSKEDTVILGRE